MSPTGKSPSFKNPIFCRWCDAGPLTWKDFGGPGGVKWRLVTKAGKVHSCRKKKHVLQRSFKRSTWRLGKGPGSFGGTRYS